MRRHSQDVWRNTAGRCMTALQQSIRSLRSASSERRHVLDEHLKQRRPEVYELVVSLREKEETDLK